VDKVLTKLFGQKRLF